MGIATILTIVFGLFSVAAILLFIWAELVRRPVFNVEPERDRPDAGAHHLWLHLLVSNRRPPWILPRELAVDCVAYVSFLDPETRQELIPQITGHWTNQPQPTDTQGNFAHWLIPTATRTNVGYRSEKVDIFIKFDDGTCYTANPWVVYLHPNLEHARHHLPEFARLRLPAQDCIVRVELEAANLGDRVTHEFRFTNTGPGLAGYTWQRLTPPEGLRGNGMTRGQRWVLRVAPDRGQRARVSWAGAGCLGVHARRGARVHRGRQACPKRGRGKFQWADAG